MATFVKHEKEWNHMLYDPSGMMGKHMHSIGRKGVWHAKRQVGVDTGAIRRSINYDVRRGRRNLVTTITAHDPKSLMHHQGTRPHIIVPKNAQTLRFPKHGKIVYAKIVRHPGTAPNRFLSDQLPKII